MKGKTQLHGMNVGPDHRCNVRVKTLLLLVLFPLTKDKVLPGSSQIGKENSCGASG